MYKHYYGIASIIFATACLIWSIGHATAVPMGPNISFGSNPVASFYGTNGSSTPDSIALQNTNQVFIVQTVMSSSDTCEVLVDGVSIYAAANATNPFTHSKAYQSNFSSFHNGTASLVIPENGTLEVKNCSKYYVSGYYAHP